LAVLCRSRPSARLLALLRLVVGADAPSQTAVVSEGAPPAAASRVEGLTGSAGRAGVLVAALGGMAIVLILQSGTVHRRRAEIAVRRSLGASRAEVGVAMALEAMVLGAIGGVLGAALGGAVLLDLVGLHVVAPVPLTGLELLAVGLVTGGLAGVAALVPAIRAARTDPADVLRSLGDG
jgi:ABC-type antimicrobial peptide transport system permease subunit